MGQPWRKHSKEFKWDEEFSIKLQDDIKQLKFGQFEPNVLVVGPSKHGKSSFINSLSTICKNRKSNVTNSGESTIFLTSALRTFNLRGVNDKVWILDSPGFVERKEGNKKQVDTIISIIKGHIRPNVELDDGCCPRGGDYWIDTPQHRDKVHCMILVLNISVFKDDSLFKKTLGQDVLAVLKDSRRLDIPRIVVLTHADKISKKVKNDISRIFDSKSVKNAVLTASEFLGIPIENIHPIVNYSNTEFARIEPLLHIPILLALQIALFFASDHLQKTGRMK